MRQNVRVRKVVDLLNAGRLPRFADERRGVPLEAAPAVDRTVNSRGYANDLLPVLPSSASENSVTGRGWGDTLPGWRKAATNLWDPASGRYVPLTPAEQAAGEGRGPIYQRFAGTQARPTMAENLGAWLASKWPAGGLTSPTARRFGRVGIGALLGGVSAGGLAYGANRILGGMFGSNFQLPVGLSALAGSGLGAALGSLLPLNREPPLEKLSSILGPDYQAGAERTDADRQTLRIAIAMDNTLPAQDKQRLLSAIGGMGSQELSQIMRLVRASGGAAIGALLMRLLFGGNTLLGGLLGAVVADQFRPGMISPTGHSLPSRVDVFGKPF